MVSPDVTTDDFPAPAKGPLPDAFVELLREPAPKLGRLYDVKGAPGPARSWKRCQIWLLASRARLGEDVNVNGVVVAYHALLEPMVSDISQVTGMTRLPAKVGKRWTDVPKVYVEKGYVIGEENGDYLYLDCRNHSVWVFFHDGAYVQRLEDSFADWLAAVEENERAAADAD